MTVDTGVFVAGVGIIITLQLAVLAIVVENARRVGHDKTARTMAQKALQRIRRHERERH
jgi:hypothetical protein